MTLHFEVISRFQAAANADALLYTLSLIHI